MPRTREFDEEKVLTAAMHAFRKRGYAGNSIKDLSAATGLTTGSIYNSYGDKDGLFAAALEHYNRTVLARRIAAYAATGRGIDGLKTLFLTLLQEPDGGSYGCLITNTAVEFGGGAPVPGPTVAGLATLRDLFADRLGAAGLPGPAVEAGAMRLLALYQGVLVLIRAGEDKESLARMIEAEFDGLARQ
ncbi:TetR/AcrR family transcriptional regulator [Frigidibacter sp. RF13]|uniref:TetR/AcrR family transcriptional regulator n=1 Tax=Frigidibacter sp. RF13 TaxID=2997340 RepID=UPI00226E61AA|nr:TetR/AcrR family transcriptional regulator [Frigidibacter sp. RF13]MCY1126913.1 TetR/AcrR family transcriptional regulator [Frigidibacter sp. RF13]